MVTLFKPLTEVLVANKFLIIDYLYHTFSNLYLALDVATALQPTSLQNI